MSDTPNAGKSPGYPALLLQLFITFLKIGPTTFGGGYAILPVIDREVTQKRQWLGAQEMGEITALSGAAPGGIGLNVAGLVGYRIAGLPGLIVAIAGIAMPTVFIMLALGMTAAWFRTNPYVQGALAGIKPTVIALIVYAAFRMGKDALRHVFGWTVSLLSVALLLWTPFNPIAVLAIGAAAGLVSEWFRHRRLRRHDGPYAASSLHPPSSSRQVKREQG
ncbi:chromate transporter [Paenibacillus thiaminolyticus]|uniref:Chromate transporter n=1 Tax=Paenibacillus thiaminolyticus TaxID=49283 RepID=A0AAP9DXD0_PANTH|nr:chromate transporter [Paenibacillus thiaminolyticus]MCY9534032.1 chromate transporter [Paenibacillus thiaminolyticus]MCY9603739.1 chromate transporter [Paenibacillus thiaminolyticus]MCY9610342.1 chromate transporter [Paenibacillus thiaminolyticus]MCY9614550.1 chromate transporter [Paenibacillus thiaminolyticus]MCY9618921.1 chromate transporter [Paenibacillus thiaminolyticus]